MNSLKLPQFPTLASSEIQAALAGFGQITTFPAGTTILETGSYVKLIPLVLSGIVKVLREGEDHDMLLYYIEPGESCIMSLAASVQNDKSEVKAVIDEDAELLLLPADKVRELQLKFPDWNQFVTELYRKRFLALLDAFNAVAYHHGDERLWEYLQRQAKRSGSPELPLTHKQIADDLGTAREVVSRLLKSLEKAGKVQLERKLVRLL